MQVGNPPKMRILSLAPADMERELNVLLNDYAVTHWHFAAVGDGVRITVVLLHASEVRKAQLMQTNFGARQ